MRVRRKLMKSRFSVQRRRFLASASAGAAFIARTAGQPSAVLATPSIGDREMGSIGNAKVFFRPFNGPYEGEFLSEIAFPLGGLGAGMICL
jgi:hypothetical protein